MLKSCMPQTVKQPVKQLPSLPDPLVFPLYSYSFTISGTRNWLKRNSSGQQRFTPIIKKSELPLYLGAKKEFQLHVNEREKSDYWVGNITVFAIGLILIWYPLLAFFRIPPNNQPSPAVLIIPAAIMLLGILYFSLVSCFDKTKQTAAFLKTIRTAQEQAFRHWVKNRYGLIVSKEQSRICSVYGMLQEKKDESNEHYELEDISGNHYRLVQDGNDNWYIESPDGKEMAVNSL